MHRRSRERGLVAFVAASLLCFPAAAEPAIWKVSDADSSIHLFGSVHIFPHRIAWRTRQFDALLKSADNVVFELVLDAPTYASIIDIGLTRGRMEEGKTLRDVLTPEDYARVASVAADAGLDMSQIDTMRPWMAAITLMGVSGPDSVAGVEAQIDGEIPADRKSALETAAEQLGFFADASLAEQIANLMSTVAGVETGAVDETDTLVEAWQEGDTEKMLAALKAMVLPEDEPLYNRLIDERNKRWVAPLEKMLAENADNLVIVGAGHLIGDSGVPALLAAAGYTVERVDRGAADGPPPPLKSDIRRR